MIETLKKFGRAVKAFISKKTVTLTGIVTFCLGLGNKYADWNVPVDEVLQGLGLFLALVVGGTVTANAKIGDGQVWGGMNGKVEDEPVVIEGEADLSGG